MPKYVYGGDVAAQQILDSDSRPDYILNSILDGIIRNPEPSISIRYPVGSIPASLTAGFSDNYATKVDQYYRYGLTQHQDSIPSNIDSYYPTYVDEESDDTNDGPPDALQGILDTLAGETIVISWYYYGLPSTLLLFNLAINNSALVEQHTAAVGRSQGRFREISTGDLYVPNLYSHVGTTLTITANPTYYFQSDNENHEQSGWRISEHIIKEFIFSSADINAIDSTDNLHQARYYLVSTRASSYFHYNEVDNTYPALNGTRELDITSGSYPYAMLIDAGNKVSEGAMGEDYLAQTDGLLKTVDLTLDLLMEGLENPDDPQSIKDVSHAFVVYAVNVNTDSPELLAYLYEHYRAYYYQQTATHDFTHSNWVTNHASDSRTGGFSGQHFYSNRIRFSAFQRWMRLTEKTGLVTDTFAAFSSAELDTLHPYVSEIDPNNNGSVNSTETFAGSGVFVPIGLVTKQVVQGINYGSQWGPDGSHQSTTHYYVIRKQLTLTTYVEIVIMGLGLYTRVDGFASQNDLTRVTVVNYLDEVDTGKIFIPLSVDVMQKFNAVNQSYIFYESLTVVVHLYNRRALEWYEAPVFWKYLGIFLTIITLGTFDWSKLFDAFLETALKTLIKAQLLKAVFSLVVDIIGTEAAIILAAIVSGLALSLDDKELLFDLIDAESLMLGATSLMAATDQVIADGFLELAEEKADYEKLVESRQEELDAMNDMIDDGSGLNIFNLVTRVAIPPYSESPSDFYNRSVHITNPGVLSLDNIDFYVKGLLALPTTNPLDDTMVPIV